MFHEILVVSLITIISIPMLISYYRNRVRVNNQQHKYNAIVNNSPIAVGLLKLGSGLKFVETNENLSDMLGYKKDEDICLKDILIQDIKHDSLIRVWLQKMEEGELTQFHSEEHILTHDGNKRVMRIMASLITLSKQKYTLLTFEDITASLNTEEILLNTEKRFEYAVNATQDGIWDWFIDTDEVYFNEAFYRMFGYEYSVLKSMDDWITLIHPDDVESFLSIMTRSIQDPEKYNYFSKEFRIKCANGKYKWTLNRGKIVEIDENGKSFRVVGTNVDIHNRRIVEQQLSESEERYAVTFASIGDGVISTDVDLNITMINDEAEKILDVKKDKALNEKIYKVLQLKNVNDNTASFKMIVEKVIKTGMPYIISKSQYFDSYIEDSIAAIYGNGNNIIGLVITFRDITDKVLTANQNMELQSQLMQAQKMESYGQFSGGIAHDINNILTVILGYTNLLSEKADEPESLDELDEIRKSCLRATSLTSKLLAFGRKQVLQLQILNINDSIKDILSMLKRVMPADIIINTEFGEIKNVNADDSQLQQIITNLTINARDAMENGEKVISIKTIPISITKKQIKERNYYDVHEGDYVLLKFSDTGIGMSDEVKNKIFEPFFTTKEVGSGTGLGLSTVYGIVKQNGGNINVITEVGKGTTFKIYWPATNEVIKSSVIEYSATQKNKSGIILFVEDESAILKLFPKSIKSWGYDVYTAKNGEEALEVAKTIGPIDLLITDMIMPKVNGKELVDKLKLEQPGIKVIYTSGYTNNADFLQEGDGFLSKPYSISDIKNKINKIL